VIAAMFDPAGGTAPDIAGKNLANPFAALFALASLLRFLGEVQASLSLRNSVLACVAAGEKTADIGGKLGTREFTQAVIARLQKSGALA
jgi:isocitrate/isopropylmalate dehydrogenase